jgi:hypothetical protein
VGTSLIGILLVAAFILHAVTGEEYWATQVSISFYYYLLYIY